MLNTTIEALNLPLWRRVPHDIEHLLLTGAPFMDIGMCCFLLYIALAFFIERKSILL